MAFNFNSPAVNFGGSSMPIGQSLNSDRPFDPDVLLGVHPVLNWATPIVRNVMFYIDRRLKGNHELDQFPIGSPCKFITGTLVTDAMKEAVLTHIEPLPQYAKDNVYRFFYVVPPTLQHLYNIQDMKKNTDGYTLESTKGTGRMNEPPSPPEDRFKQFYEIQRVFVYLRERGYAPAEIGSFDPSNEDVTPVFAEDHAYTGYDAQLVNEEVVPFEEDYMNKVFVRVIRIYKTLPGPVIKELLTYNSYVNGQTVWIQGAPDSGIQGIAEVGQRWSREVWGFPRPESTSSFSAIIPTMPAEATESPKINKGWDKGSFPCLQMYVITSMYKSNSNIPLDEKTDSLSGNCCNPPPAFVRCVNTSTTRSETIDWSSSSTLPPLNPPDPSENCSQWRVDASVVVREGYSHKETRKTCTTYDMVEHYFETEIDSKTGNEIVVQYTRIDNPAQDPEGPEWVEVTDSITGVKTWVRDNTASTKTDIMNCESPELIPGLDDNRFFVFAWGDDSLLTRIQTTDPKFYSKGSCRITSVTLYLNDPNWITHSPDHIVRLSMFIYRADGTFLRNFTSSEVTVAENGYVSFNGPASGFEVNPGERVCFCLIGSTSQGSTKISKGLCDINGNPNSGWCNSAKGAPDYPNSTTAPYIFFRVTSTLSETPIPTGYLKYRKWINPCHAVEILRPVPGLGWYKKYTTVQNYSFPPILGSFGWQGWDTRPDLSGRVGRRYFPQIFMNKDGYSGPCQALVEEIFSPDGTLPSGWGLGVDVQYVTASASISTPLVSFNLPACLHTSINIVVTIGTHDGVWQSGSTSYYLPATKHTTWKNVTMVHVFPYQKGAYIRKTIIYPPS